MLDDRLIGDFKIEINESSRKQKNITISSINFSNGKAFDGYLRNVFYTRTSNETISNKIYNKYASKFDKKNIVLLLNEDEYKTPLNYKLINLNWNSFSVSFDYTHTNNQCKLIIGDKWKVIEFRTKNDKAFISTNYNRESFVSHYNFTTNKQYKIELIVNHGILELTINGEVVLKTKFEYTFKHILERENEILILSDNTNPNTDFSSIIVKNNTQLNSDENFITNHKITNKTVDSIEEGLLAKYLTQTNEIDGRFEENIKDYIFLQNVAGFNNNTFEISFSFMTDFSIDQNIFRLGTYTKYTEINLSISNNQLSLKKSNGKINIPLLNQTELTNKWNSCKITYQNKILEVYLNNIKIFETKTDISPHPHNSKIISIEKSFIGKMKNLYFYESKK